MKTKTALLTEPQMPLNEWEKTREFNALTAKEKMWCRSCVESRGDFHFATKTAYQAKNDLNALIMSHSVRKYVTVVDAMRLLFPDYLQAEVIDGEEERKQFFAAIQRKILRGKLSIADVEACKMVCRERGWDQPSNLPAGRNGYVKVAERDSDPRVPQTATHIWKRDGVVIGYRDANGQDIKL